jgi:hypothetical protein
MHLQLPLSPFPVAGPDCGAPRLPRLWLGPMLSAWWIWANVRSPSFFPWSCLRWASCPCADVRMGMGKALRAVLVGWTQGIYVAQSTARWSRHPGFCLQLCDQWLSLSGLDLSRCFVRWLSSSLIWIGRYSVLQPLVNAVPHVLSVLYWSLLFTWHIKAVTGIGLSRLEGPLGNVAWGLMVAIQGWGHCEVALS